jgi:hypothetical protein
MAVRSQRKASASRQPRHSPQGGATRGEDPPFLEPLEDRVTPTNCNTTNVAVAITPNMLGRTAAETTTATVTQQGTTTPVTAGTINFNVNGGFSLRGRIPSSCFSSVVQHLFRRYAP